MATWLPCPYLSGVVELTDEREWHIATNHPDLLPEHRDRLAETLTDPDQIRVSEPLAGTRMFSRWFPSVRGGKHVVLIVVSDPIGIRRHWIITAYLTRKLTGGITEWTRT